jgi:hypothetical protein
MIHQLIEIRNNILSALEQNDGILAKMYVNKLDTLLHSLSNQQEKMYSEEEVKQIIDATLIEYSDFVLVDVPHWFEQFKKK